MNAGVVVASGSGASSLSCGKRVRRSLVVRTSASRNTRATTIEKSGGVCDLRSSRRQHRVGERWHRLFSGANDESKADEGEGVGPSSTSSAPSTTQEEQEETPLWVRREQAKELNEQKQEGEIPFGVYLLASCIVAIAAIASIFEYTYQNAIFSVIPPSSFLYKPILGIFVFTGLPLSGFLFFKAIKSANELSESMDKMDNMR